MTLKRREQHGVQPRLVQYSTHKDMKMTTLITWDEIEEHGPGDHPDMFDASLYRKRWDFIEQYSFAIPIQEAIKKIAKFIGSDSLLEVGAGSGLWSYLISQEGVSVTAVDDHSWNKHQQVPGKDNISIGYYYHVQKSNGTRAVKKYADYNALLLCWPPYKESMAANALNAFTGTKLIYIGEGHTGCTADDRFHRMIDEWKCTYVQIPQWPGIHDSMFIS